MDLPEELSVVFVKQLLKSEDVSLYDLSDVVRDRDLGRGGNVSDIGEPGSGSISSALGNVIQFGNWEVLTEEVLRFSCWSRNG